MKARVVRDAHFDDGYAVKCLMYIFYNGMCENLRIYLDCNIKVLRRKANSGSCLQIGMYFLFSYFDFNEITLLEKIYVKNVL